MHPFTRASRKRSTSLGLLRGSAKRATTFSNWSSQPARPGGASHRVDRAVDESEHHRTARQYHWLMGKLRKSPSTGGSLSGGQVRRSSVLTEAGAPAPPNLPPFEIRAFPSSFKKKQSGLAENFSRIDFFPSKGLKAKRRNSRPPRSTDFRVSDPVRSTAVGKR